MWIYISFALIMILFTILLVVYYSDYKYVVIEYGTNQYRPCRYYYRLVSRYYRLVRKNSIRYYHLSDKDLSFSESLELIDKDSGKINTPIRVIRVI